MAVWNVVTTIERDGLGKKLDNIPSYCATDMPTSSRMGIKAATSVEILMVVVEG